MSSKSKLCHDYCSMTSACLDRCLSALRQQSFSRVTNKQPNKTENLIPALHFSQFWFMTCCCLFPRPKSFQTPDWFSPESLFVCCWQPPVCAYAAVVHTSTQKHTHARTHTQLRCTHSGITTVLPQKSELTTVSCLCEHSQHSPSAK